ncbi:right-handed parallel beta-helix repeat-containing protein, partial [bacterium]|nr:right-handed parallel beta-helix repeat-containing protein [bacterium]
DTPVNLSNQTYSELVLCNTDGATLNNITIDGSNTLDNNALYLEYVDNSVFDNINSSGNQEGIYGYRIQNNRISNSTFNNNHTGVSLLYSSQNTFDTLHLDSNGEGYRVFSGSGNILKGSTITNSKSSGIGQSEVNNYYFDNYFSNNDNVDLHSSPGASNFWNTSTSPGPNIVGGPYFGGNYWSNPSATGYSDTCSDSDSNGFCDQPYDVEHEDSDCSDTHNCDHLPLVQSLKWYLGGNSPDRIYRYNSDWSYDSSWGAPCGDVWDLFYDTSNGHWYVACNSPDYVYERDSNWKPVASHWVGTQCGYPRSLFKDGNYWYLACGGFSPDRVFQYDSNWNYTGHWWSLTNCGDVYGLYKYNNHWFAVNNSPDKVCEYDSSWNFVGNHWPGWFRNPRGLWNKGGHWYIPDQNGSPRKVHEYDAGWHHVSSHNISPWYPRGIAVGP